MRTALITNSDLHPHPPKRLTTVPAGYGSHHTAQSPRHTAGMNSTSQAGQPCKRWDTHGGDPVGNTVLSSLTSPWAVGSVHRRGNHHQPRPDLL